MTDPNPLHRLFAIMARLRDPQYGCEWDIAQSFASIAPYTIEEAYEVADAITRGDHAALKEELGDLLLQIVFHARIAEEAGLFDFAAITTAIADKMETRHPHIFGQDRFAPADQEVRWEELKAAERAASGSKAALDGIALALPALLRAEKLQKRAARQGFDWPDITGPTAKVVEEIDELAQAASIEDKFEEAGDFLFAAVNLVRAHGISAEDALRAGNAKFERRYRAMEQLASDRKLDFATLSLDEQDALWRDVKQSEPRKTP